MHSDVPLPAKKTPPRMVRGPVVQFAIFALAGMILMVCVTLGVTDTSPAAMALGSAGYTIAVVLAIGLLRRGFPYPTLGFCNVVTLARLALAAALLAPLVHQIAPPWAVFAIAATALALDGADGWLARREGRVSAFGARFDMEVDAALALILALNAWAAGTVSMLVVLIGLPRYVFIAASVGLPWLGAALPDRLSRKAVCVLQVGVLVALQLPVLPAGVGSVLVAIVAVALSWSFGRDILWLWRHRA